MQVITIGLDLAKSVFQVHGVDASGTVVVRRQLRRSQVLSFFAGLEGRCLVGLEACASAHHWAREIGRLGHDVRLMAPSHVKPYVRRNKTDAADAAAICEAVSRPSMRFVPVKTEPAQAELVLHRSRALLVRQRTMVVNCLRGLLYEFGHVAAPRQGGLNALMGLVEHHLAESGIPALAAPGLRALVDQIRALSARIGELERAIRAAQAQSEAGRRLATIPAIGPITASALVASVPDARAFRSGRAFAAWLGLTPRLTGTGGRQRLGPITKKGDSYVRTLLVLGATSLLRRPGPLSPRHRAWLEQLRASKPGRLTAVALANKLARIAWAVLVRGSVYDTSAALPQAA